MRPHVVGLIIFFGLVIRVVAADVGVELAGVMGTGKEVRVALRNTTSGTTQWVAIGGTYVGYTVASYDPKTDVVVVTKGGQRYNLGLKQGKVAKGETKPSPLVERAILNNLRQLAAAADQFFLENGKTITTYDDLVGPTKYVKAITPVEGENYRALQFVQGRTFVVTTTSGHTVSYAP